jgi:FMN-dependent NADH-azoreductase
MSTVLVLNSSITGAYSASRPLVEETVANLRAKDPDLRVVTRDLAVTPVPHLTPATVGAIGKDEPATDDAIAARALSDELVAELQGADTIIIGAPMYNFGIPSTLKTWFDYVIRAGVTFRYSEAGAEGLVTGKRAVVVLTRGGLYSEGPAQALDSQEPHLRTLLGFIGITDVTFVRAERLLFGPEPREQALAAARAEIGRYAPALAEAA